MAMATFDKPFRQNYKRSASRFRSSVVANVGVY